MSESSLLDEYEVQCITAAYIAINTQTNHVDLEVILEWAKNAQITELLLQGVLSGQINLKVEKICHLLEPFRVYLNNVSDAPVYRGMFYMKNRIPHFIHPL